MGRIGQVYGRFEERVGALRQFRVHTFLVLLVVGVSIVFYLNNYVRNDVLERLGESATFVTETTISPYLNASDFNWSQDKPPNAKFNRIIKKRLLDASKKTVSKKHFQFIKSVKVWNKDYRVIYDSKGEQTGFQDKANHELKEVLANNESETGFSQGDLEDKSQNVKKGHLIEVYIPAIFKGSDKPVGAFEIYLSTHAINQFTSKTTFIILIITLLGLLFLYFTLSWFFARAHRRISEKNNELHKITDKLMGSLKELEENYLGTIQALTMAVDAKDHYTAGHSFRVAAFSKEIGKIMGLSEDALRDLERGARFHDIGKIGIKETILNKEASLTEAEYDEMKRHPLIGAKILGQVKFLQDIVPIVRWHHERLNASGYPDALSKVNIPLAAKIVAVADVFDSMTSDRPYRKAFDTDTAFEELKSGAGTKYDKEAVQALIETYSGASCVFRKSDKDNELCLIDDDNKSKKSLDSLTADDIEKIWADSNSSSDYQLKNNKRSKRKSAKKKTA